MENNTILTDISKEPAAAEPADIGGHLFKLIAHTIVLLLGVPGNLLILRVYWAKIRKNSTHVLIMALAWADFSVCLIGVHRIAMAALNVKGERIPIFFDLILPFEHTAVGTSVVITAIIAVDRYDCICRPNRRFFNYRRGKTAAFAALPFSLVMHIPLFIKEFTASDSSDYISVLASTAQGFSFVAALVIIILCYVRVYITIRKHVKTGAVPQGVSREDNSMGFKRWTRWPPGCSAQRRSDMSLVNKTTLTNKPGTKSSTIRAKPPEIREKFSDASTSVFVIPDSSKANLATQAINNTDPHQGNTTGHAPQRVGGAILHRRTTWMLFITSVVFILAWLPYWIWVVLTFANHNEGSLSKLSLVFYAVQIILFLNNAVNPLVYGLANRRFRKDCREVFTKTKLC